MYKKLYSTTLFLSFFLVFPLFLFSSEVFEQELNTSNSDWTVVSGGKALCKPQTTSYGFAFLTDGKMLCAVSENGKKLWEKGIEGKNASFLKVFSSDFLLVVSDKKNISLVNPSGLTLWTKKLSFEIITEPVLGRDSRIFVTGKHSVACFGVNGVCKWKIDLEPLKKISPVEMNDGSIIVFHEKSKNNRTSGTRISPFGEILETISFAGNIVNSLTLPQQGVLLVFSGNGAGLCVVKENQTVTKWAIPSADKVFDLCTASLGANFILLKNQKSALALAKNSNESRILVFRNSDGFVTDYFDVPIKYTELSCCKSTFDGQNIFISDRKNAILTTSEGRSIWKGKFPPSNSWNFCAFTNKNYLVICSNSWVLTGFRTFQRLSSNNANTKNQRQKATYRNFYNINGSVNNLYIFNEKIPSELIGTNRIKLLQEGNYGSKEKEIAFSIISVSNAYLNFLTTSNTGARLEKKSAFETDTTGLGELIVQTGLMGTDECQNILASIIKSEDKNIQLYNALKTVSNFGYDPDGQILNALDNRRAVTPTSNSYILIELCNAVYSVCRFMGRPALYKHGMDILTTLLYPQYDNKVREQARKTLSEIAKLNI